MIPNSIIQLAAQGVVDAYKDNIDLGTTEFSQTVVSYKGDPYQLLSIPGTNEALDWIENLHLESEDNMHKPSKEAAEEIHSWFGRLEDIPLVVTGHSKGAREALCYSRLFGADYTIAFCPVKCFVDEFHMKNTLLFIDPDDPVPKAFPILYNHPICDTIYLPNDHFGLSIGDHFMDHVLEFVNNM
jgi:hypothetical protein